MTQAAEAFGRWVMRCLAAVYRCYVAFRLWLRRWRWRRLEQEQSANLHDHRTPVQVCPRGCKFHERARSDLLTYTRWWGKAVIHFEQIYETNNCPFCGSPLARTCARCKREIFAPVVDRCQYCGIPQPWAHERRPGTERISVQQWHPLSKDVHEPARFLYGCPGRGDIWVVEGDIARLKVDAVVSNDDVDGRMWAQVSRAIKSAAGDDIERIAQEGKPFKLGEAWPTRAGALDIKGIVHVASMDRHGQSSIGAVRKCLVKSFEVAEEKEYETLGVAAIGSGPVTIDPVAWSRAFIEVAVSHLCKDRDAAGSLALSVILVLFEPADYEAIVDSLRLAVWEAWTGPGKRRGEPALQFVRSRRWRVLGRSHWLAKPDTKPLPMPRAQLTHEPAGA